jgi:hypothetical protein
MNVGAQQAEMSGIGTVGRKAPIDLKSQEPVLRMTMHITRKDTGKVETYELIGTPIEDKEQ